jgi:hypothetical protein
MVGRGELGVAPPALTQRKMAWEFIRMKPAPKQEQFSGDLLSGTLPADVRMARSPQEYSESPYRNMISSKMQGGGADD